MTIILDIQNILNQYDSTCFNRKGSLYPYILEQINIFLTNPDENVAINCFNRLLNFFNRYLFTKKFLLDLNIYEKSVGKLLPSYRLHFLHVLYVYSLGLCIYLSNNKVKYCFKDQGYFLYLWTLTALLHDIGYPCEISARILQISIGNVANINYNRNAVSFAFNEDWFKKISFFDESKGLNCWNELSRYFKQRFPKDRLTKNYQDYLFKNFSKEINTGYINHGTIGALLILNILWESYKDKGKKGMLKYRRYVVASASSVYFHTNYKHILHRPKRRFQLSLKHHPLAYLLVLCDELQEWARFHPSQLFDSNIDTLTDKEINEYTINKGDGNDERLSMFVPNKKLKKMKENLSVLYNWRDLISIKDSA